MSRSKGERKPVKLKVTVGPATETFILDHSLKLQTRGVGSFATELNPGLYKIKFRAGTVVHEAYQVIEAGSGTITIRPPELKFSSPAPLSETLKTHAYHMRKAEELSKKVHRKLGRGSQLFLFVRTWGPRTQEESVSQDIIGSILTPPPKYNPATGLTLQDVEGNLLFDFEHEARYRLGVPSPWAGCNLELSPGSYRLRVQTRTWGALEQIIVASPGWQTQVFLLLDDYSEKAEPDFRADLANGSILLSKWRAGFDAGKRHFRLAEAARVALVNRRTVLPEHQLRRMLSEKCVNPMLGIYAAHALLAASKPDKKLLASVVRNLSNLLGPHPDVDALRLYLGDDPKKLKSSFGSPPMLSSSWLIIVEKSIKHPALVPLGSLSSRASTQLWGGGPWLIWLADQLKEEARAEPTLSVTEGLTKLMELTPELERDKYGQFKAKPELDEMEQALLRQLTPSLPPREMEVGRPELREEGEVIAESEVFGTESVGIGPEGKRVPAVTEGPRLEEDVLFGLKPRVARRFLSPARAKKLAKALCIPPSALESRVGRLLEKLEAHESKRWLRESE